MVSRIGEIFREEKMTDALLLTTPESLFYAKWEEEEVEHHCNSIYVAVWLPMHFVLPYFSFW